MPQAIDVIVVVLYTEYQLTWSKSEAWLLNHLLQSEVQ